MSREEELKPCPRNNRLTAPQPAKDAREPCKPMDESESCLNTVCPYYEKDCEQNCSAVTEDEGPYAEICTEWNYPHSTEDSDFRARILQEAAERMCKKCMHHNTSNCNPSLCDFFSAVLGKEQA